MVWEVDSSRTAAGDLAGYTVCEIPFHRVKREEELVGDFVIGESIGDQFQYLEFPFA